MSTVVGGVVGVVMWIAASPLVSKFAVRRRGHVAIGAVMSFVLVAIAFDKWGVTWIGATAAILVVGFVVLAEIDIACRRLPREISFPLASVALLFVAGAAVSDGNSQRIVAALLGMVTATVVMVVLYVVSRGGLGDGDVRLAPALGVTAAFGGVSTLWTGALFAFLAAGATVLALVLVGRMGRGSTLPFGPFLVAGAIVSILGS